MQITDEFLQLSIPDQTMGETVGVATNSKGHLFVYSRTNPQGIARGGTAAMLFEFDENMKFVKQWGPHNYAASFAHSVRVDKNDNVWMVDEGSGMIIKFDPQAVPQAQFGRTPEAIDYLEEFLEHGGTGFNNAGGTAQGPASDRHDRHIQPSNRCDLGFAGQYLCLRRLRQLAHRQDHAGRPLAEGQWEPTAPARISSGFRIASPRTPRTTFTLPTAITAASRSTTGLKL